MRFHTLLLGTVLAHIAPVRSCGNNPANAQLNVRLKTFQSDHNDGNGWFGKSEFRINLQSAQKDFNGNANTK